MFRHHIPLSVANQLLIVLILFFSLFSGPFAAAANLNVAKPGSGFGLVSSSGRDPNINCGADCTGSYSNGASVTLTATPNAADFSKFVKWGPGLCYGQNRTCALTTTFIDQTVAATFSGAAIAAGNEYTVALKSDGTVWAWGWNDSGQLGDGTTLTRFTPIQASSLNLNDLIAIAAGGNHTVALKSDGTVWAWGHNYSGQLGDGTTTNRPIPLQVSLLNLINGIAIAAGFAHTVALRSDGTVWAWGNNYSGELGDGSTTDRSISVQVKNMGNVIAIAAGSGHTVALKSDGTVWTWGSNYSGQLGDGTTTNRAIPVLVNSPYLNNIIAIAAGGSHTVALKSDGTVWTWGYNDVGQLGDGTTTNRTTPVQVNSPYLNTIIAIAGGRDHTVALKSNGTVWTWGYNISGQLGDGSNTNSNLPVQVHSVGDVGFLRLFPASQTITFGAAPTVVVGGTGTVSATATSGLAVTFTSQTNGVCTVSGSTVTGVTTGACTMAANQAGNSDFLAAPSVTQTFNVDKISQTIGAISFNPATLTVGGTTTVSATGGASGNPVTFGTTTPSVCTVNGSTVTGVAVGACTIAANQAGNANYSAAPQVTQNLTVGPVGPVSQTIGPISFTPATLTVGGTTTASATATSGLAVTFSSLTPSVCTVSGNTVTGVAVGACTIAANQAGNASYSAAPQVTQTFNVIATLSTISAIGVFRNGQWYLDGNGNGAWDGCGTEFCFSGFGTAGDMPASGNWDGGGKSTIGVLRSGTGEWFLDRNGNQQWDGCVTDGCYVGFGSPGDLPVAGDWSGNGVAKIGVFRNGQWFLDNGNGAWDGCGAELCLNFGQAGDLPAAGNWDGGLKAGVGVFRAGTWYLDYNGNGAWDGCQQEGGQDKCLFNSFGLAGDLPAAGDWNGGGKAKVGVFRNGTWYLDYNGNGAWDGCSVDRCYEGSFGQAGDLPVAGKW